MDKDSNGVIDFAEFMESMAVRKKNDDISCLTEVRKVTYDKSCIKKKKKHEKGENNELLS